MFIYLAINTINGKYYVGQTRSRISHRKSNHFQSADQGSQAPFHRALRKYGRGAFYWVQLAEAKDLEELDRLEQEWIARLQSQVPQGYNVHPGGKSQDSGSLSEAQRRVWSKDPERRVRQSDHNRRVWDDEETGPVRRENVRKAMRGRSRPVRCVETGEIFETIPDASRSVGRSNSAVSLAIQRGHRCGGYTWEYYGGE